MVEDGLTLIYKTAWAEASEAERLELWRTANLNGEASPAAVFAQIARDAAQIDPILTTLLWDELAPARHITRIELGDVQLSEPVSQAMQFALAYELGRRIDRVLAELGGAGDDVITQKELETKATAAGVHWQVVSYALGRKRNGQGGAAK